MDPEKNETQKGSNYKVNIQVWGNLVAFLEIVGTEFFMTLQCIDPCTREFVERLRDEPTFLVLAQNIQDYLQQTGDHKAAAKVALRRVELIYYKPQEVYEATRKLADLQLGEDAGKNVEIQDNRGADDFVVITEIVPRQPSFPESSRALTNVLVTLHDIFFWFSFMKYFLLFCSTPSIF